MSVRETIFSREEQGGFPRLLVGLHDGVGDEGRRDLVSAKPATVQPLDGLLGGFDRIELEVYFTLHNIQC